ncbi:MAG TPA: carboxypeptidase regulatory-like domain-containing protein [Pirellulales bacterium]|nr:carboxypeptidase regulatory-like domain-containing protein [Pirellulales bacterium]
MKYILSLCALLHCVGVAGADPLKGVVVCYNGQPAPGATISAARIFHSPPWRATVTAAADGAFSIDLPRCAGSERYIIAVRHQNEGAEFYETLDAQGKSVRLEGQSLPPMTVHLRPGGALRGRVLQAEDDRPIPGARLFLDTGEVLTTDERGAFRLTGLTMKDHNLIPVAAGRVRPYVLFDNTHRPDCELDLRLPRGATIRGRILDERGDPITNAYLTRRSSGTSSTLNGWDQLAEPDGTFVYSGISAERLFYSLQAEAPGYSTASLSAEVADPDAVIQKIVRLKRHDVEHQENEDAKPGPVPVAATTELPRRTITGTVKDPEGKPRAGVSVRWGAHQWDPSVPSTETDSDGRYTLARVPQGTGALLFVAEGCAPQFATLPDEGNRLDVQLAAGTSVRGVVKGATGKPVAGVRIVPLTHCLDTGFGNPIWLSERAVSTDSEGRFAIAALPAAVTFDILKEGYSEKRNQALELGGAENEVQLQTGGGVRGVVVDQQGKPVRDFKIRLMIPRGLQQGEQAGGYYAGYDWYGALFTRDDGVFVLSALGAEHWGRLLVSSPGVGKAVLNRVQAHSLEDLPPADALRIPLKPFTPVQARVLDARTGKPIAGAVVSLLEDEHDFSQGFQWGYHDLWANRARTDAEGRATIREPACDDGTILVTAEGFARRHLPWTQDSGELQISLEPAATIEGEVRMEDRFFVGGWVRITSADKDSYNAALDDRAGRFLFEMLPAGEYTFEVHSRSNQRLYARQLKLEAGQNYRENVQLPYIDPMDAAKKAPAAAPR